MKYLGRAWGIELIDWLHDDGGVETVKLAFVFVLTLTLPLLAEEKTGVSWAMVDPFCGQVISAEPETFPIKAAEMKLYRATAKHLPCCGSAKELGSVPADGSGKFDLRNVAPGQYWLVARWKKTEVAVAVWYEGKYHFACDERYNHVIKIKPSAGTAEITTITSEDSLTNAKTY